MKTRTRFAAPRIVRDWSADEVERLRDHLKEGVSLVDIAGALSRTPEEVAMKLADFRPVPHPGRRLRREEPSGLGRCVKDDQAPAEADQCRLVAGAQGEGRETANDRFN